MNRLLLILIGCSVMLVMGSSSGCKNKSETSASVPETIQEPPAPPAPPPAPTPPDQPLTRPQPDPRPKNALVKIHTIHGDMIVKLYDETPAHRDNFLMLAKRKYYDGLLFHRVIKSFMIQGGDPDSRGAAPSQHLGMGGPGYTIPAEFNPAFIHKKGALSAARQPDMVNPARESSGSQFYVVQGQPVNDPQIAQIEAYVSQKMPGFKYTEEQKNIYRTIGGTAHLDMDYTIFGEVVEGLDVIDKIAAQPTAPGDRPVNDIVMSMEVIRE